VALDQVLARVGTVAAGLRVGVVSPAQLERVELQLRREFVERALEAERALDEARSTEGLRRRQVELRAVRRRLHVRARVEHPQWALGHRDPAVRTDPVHAPAPECGERAVAARADRVALDRRVAVTGGDVLLAPRQRAANRATGAARQLGGDERVLARAVLRAEAAAHVLADDTD